ncbi:MAG TPA: trimethylamine methyltransferase family protein [Anaerolineales bacterium]|nr:trimethylamine methyltransferase family protein [Anaerolineales bacterium]
MINYASLLTSEQVQRVHETSLEILENVGLLVRNDKARSIFSKHGCNVDTETLIVKFPRAVVEKYRTMLQPTFTFRGRDPKYDRTIPQDGPLIITGSSAPNIIDPLTGQERRARSDDIARIAHLINELAAIDIFSISTLADDAPEGQFTLARLYPALKYCLKPVRSTTKDMEDIQAIMRLLYAIAGSEAAYREHPFVTHHYCPVVSPLTMDKLSTEAIIHFSEINLPVYPSIVPNAGLTSPMSMAGTVAQGNAEFLAAAVLMQMVREGTPTIYASLPTVADMRTGAYASGGIECGILHMAFAQMARFYNVPCGGYIGLSNSKVNDAQSGYETGMSSVAGVLAGADMLNMAGLLDALKVFDFAKAVIDDEVAQMLKRVKRGIPFNEEELALAVIAQTKPGGSFLMNPHTAKRMKTEALLTKISDRDQRNIWEKKGSLDTHAHAMQRANEILAKSSLAIFPPEVEERIRNVFPALVPGVLEMPK